jgi:hypothetical protein
VHSHEYNSSSNIVAISEGPKCTLLIALRVFMRFVFVHDLHCDIVADATILDAAMSKSVHLHQREFWFKEFDW